LQLRQHFPSATRQKAPAAPLPVTPAGYAGSDACKACHEDLYTKRFELTAHYKTTLQGGHGCESCHGPGGEHVAGGVDLSKIVRFKELTRQQASARCLGCHGDSEGQTHFNRSAHTSNDVGCLECHSPHHAKEEHRLLTKGQPELCHKWHAATKAEFAKPFHHRVKCIQPGHMPATPYSRYLSATQRQFWSGCYQ
jgi:DmsE family decaheme c-type cytochrome